MLQFWRQHNQPPRQMFVCKCRQCHNATGSHLDGQVVNTIVLLSASPRPHFSPVNIFALFKRKKLMNVKFPVRSLLV